MDKIKQAVANWKRSREATISSLRRCANVLRNSHKENAKSEYKSASASLVGDLVGSGGLLLAPFSGGLSLTAVGASSAVGIGSYLNKRDANKEDENTTKEVLSKVDRVLKQDERDSDILQSIIQKLASVEDQLFKMNVDDMISSLEERTVTNISIRAKEIRTSDLENKLQQQQQKNTTMSSPFLDLSKQVANLTAALTSAEQVVKYTAETKMAYTATRTIQQVVSTAQSVNKVTQTAKSLATAKQAADITIQAGKSTVGCASVAIGVGVVSTATKSAGVAVDIGAASGQAVTVISTATKGVDSTIKTVKNIKQASNTVKTAAQAIDTTRITTNVSRMTKVTKLTRISKCGLAINAVTLPLSIINLINASDNLENSYRDVNSIKDVANSLEKEMNENTIEIERICELVHQLHVQLCKMYEDHHIELIFNYLKLIHENLDFDIPLRK